MAFPAWAAAAVQGGSGIIAPVISAFANKSANKKANQQNTQNFFLEDLTNRLQWERENSYSENVWNMQNEKNEEIWNKMNAYNTPTAQMDRFKEAGLNPNLIYGQGNSTGSISTAQFGKNSAGSASTKNAMAPHYNFDGISSAIGGGLSSMLNMRESSARVNNLEAQNDVLKQDAIKRAAETAGLQTDNQSKAVNLKVLSETAMDAAQLANNRMRIGTQIDLERNEREAVLNSSNLREAGERILNMRGERMNKQLDNQLKQLDLNLKSMGIQPSDNMIIRMMGQWLQQFQDTKIYPPGDMRW